MTNEEAKLFINRSIIAEEVRVQDNVRLLVALAQRPRAAEVVEAAIEAVGPENAAFWLCRDSRALGASPARLVLDGREQVVIEHAIRVGYGAFA